MHEHNLLSWCLLDPSCVAMASGSAAAAVAVARRMLALDTLPRSQRGLARTCRRCFAGAVISGTATGALCLLGGDQWPTRLTSVAASTVLVGVALDWSSGFAVLLLRRAILAIGTAFLEGTFGAKVILPPTPQQAPSFPDDPPEQNGSGDS